MSKKVQGNGLWVSSRMMLPEHQKSIINHRKKLNCRSQRMLDEQEVDRICRLLVMSMEERVQVTIELYDPFKCSTLIGRVIDIDVLGHRVKLLLSEMQKQRTGTACRQAPDRAAAPVDLAAEENRSSRPPFSVLQQTKRKRFLHAGGVKLVVDSSCPQFVPAQAGLGVRGRNDPCRLVAARRNSFHPRKQLLVEYDGLDGFSRI